MYHNWEVQILLLEFFGTLVDRPLKFTDEAIHHLWSDMN